MFDASLGEFAIGGFAGEGSPEVPPPADVLRFATHSFTTAGTDDPPHTPISGRVLSSFTLRREIAAGPDGRFGGLIRAQISSEIVLDNSDRALDGLLDLFVDGRPVRVRIGTSGQSYQDMPVVLTATAGAFSADQRTIRLRLRDPGLLLRGAIQGQVYSGAGGRNGDDAVAGRTKPLLYGRVANVEPQLIDEAVLIYHVADRPLSSLTVYDAGVVVPFETNHATFEAMLAADVTPGSMASCLDQGFFRLAIRGTGRITCDAIATTGASTAEVIDEILDDAGVPVDQRSIVTIPDADGDLPGYYLPSGTNAAPEDVIVELAAAAGAAFGADRDGIYRLVWLDADTLGGGPDFTFTDVIEIETPPLPYGVPWRGWRVGGARNWTVQAAGELAQSLAPARIQFLEREFREIRTGDPEIAVRHPTSAETELVPTYYLLTVPAVRFGDRMAAWYALGRRLFRIVVKTALCAVEVGDRVRLELPFWGLDAGLTCAVVAVEDDLGSGRTELTLFG